MNKAREFWVEDDGSWNLMAYTSKRKADLNCTNPTIHVIEYKAYEAAVKALKEISLSTEFIHGYGEVPTESAKKALETLKELGEHE